MLQQIKGAGIVLHRRGVSIGPHRLIACSIVMAHGVGPYFSLLKMPRHFSRCDLFAQQHLSRQLM